MSIKSIDSSAFLLFEPSTTNINSRISYQAPLSMAYEKTIMKEKCGLCAMYFHRNSVKYKVPNHRIYELEKSWNIKRSGRRYQNAAFLYKIINVCCFCSQFFKLLPDELLKSQELNQTNSNNSIEKPLKLDITTKLERTNIAIEQRTYQSSVIDNHIASNAIIYPSIDYPYEIIAKTKRVVDSWWEIDFSQKFHIHSLSFLISTSKRQKLVFSIFLLNRPYGFEDPFYDSIKSKAIISKEITILEKDQPQMNPIEWKLSDVTYCAAIRIQIKGIHILGIQQFKTYRGDILVPLSPRDLENTMNSYATLSPAAIKLGRYEMMSAEKKKEMIQLKDSNVLNNNEHNSIILNSQPKITLDVNNLAMTIYKKNLKLDKWKKTVLQAIEIFSQDEIEALYKVIFKYASDLCVRNINAPAIKENELRTSALLQHCPRCELNELHQRVRSVVRWIQTRSHLKNLGVLANSKNFEIAANDPSVSLYDLQTAFKRIEYYWNKKEIKEQSIILNSIDKLKFKGTKVSECRGCSWSQFLVTISLFCTQETTKIPMKAFFVKEIRAAYSSDILLNNTLNDKLSPISNHTVNSKGFEDDNISYGSGNGRSVSTYSLYTYDSLRDDNNDLQITDKQVWLNDISSPKTINQEEMKKELESNKTFLEKARTKELFPYYNSSFSEYKFAKFQRKIKFKEIMFPKQLDLKFAESLFPRRGEIMESIYEDQDIYYDNNNINNNTDHPGIMAASALEGDRSGMDEIDKESTLMNGDVINISRPRINTIKPSRKTRIASMMPSINTSPGRNRFASIMTSSTTTATKTGMNLNNGIVNNNEKNSRLSTITSLTRPSTTKQSIPNNNNNSMKSRSSMLKTITTTNKTLLQRPKTTQTFDINKTKHHVLSPTTTSHHNDHDSDSQSIGSMNYSSDAGDLNGEKGGGNKYKNKASAVLDFFRVCSLCEKKFTRDAIDKKVIKKHVIDLRNSWDPNLVPKETKLLSNSITMYNLVYVCLFCYQFFDPDYADGIAYPVRIDSPSISRKKGVLGAIESQSSGHSPYKLFYDNRYETNSIEVGEVFHRPLTVESRIRALKAIEISKSFDSKR